MEPEKTVSISEHLKRTSSQEHRAMRSQGWKCVAVTQHRERPQWTGVTKAVMREVGRTSHKGYMCRWSGPGLWRITVEGLGSPPRNIPGLQWRTSSVLRALLSPSSPCLSTENLVSVTGASVRPRTAMASSVVLVSLFCYKSGFKYYSVFQNLSILKFSRV